MVSSMDPVNRGMTGSPRLGDHPPLIPREMRPEPRSDRLDISRNTKIGNDQAMNMVLERAMEKLRSVVGEARAELGIPEGTMLDTSSEATASRIVEFALQFFETYANKHGLSDDEEGRRAFVGFIGKAVNQGIDEARGILNALSALNPSISANIDKTAGIINNRFEDFILNGRG